MVVKAGVLGGDKCVLHVLGEILDAHEQPLFAARQGGEERVVPVQNPDRQLFIAQLLLVQHVPGIPAQHVGSQGQYRHENQRGQQKKPPLQAAVGVRLVSGVSFPSHDGLVWDERKDPMLFEQESADALLIQTGGRLEEDVQQEEHRLNDQNEDHDRDIGEGT